MTANTKRMIKQYLDDVNDSAPGISATNLLDLIVLEFALTPDEAQDVYSEWCKEQ